MTHTHHTNTFNRAFFLAITLNLLFTLLEGSYAFIAHSNSLLADAGHNLGDVLGLGLAWGAHHLLQRKPSSHFSYGFKRTTLIAALINALILIATCALILSRAIHSLHTPQPINEMAMIIVAAIGIIINGSTALLFIRGQEDLNLRGAFLHLATDALISLGVVITGIVLYFYPAWWLDSVVSMLIVVAIVASTWRLLCDSIRLLLDGVPQTINAEDIRQYLCALPHVSTVHDLHIWALSTQETALTAHLVMPGHALADNDHQRIHQHLSEHFNISHITLQTEQGQLHRDPAHTNCH
jgi:cobalt-zinc-cadmium efflux system protein